MNNTSVFDHKKLSIFVFLCLFFSHSFAQKDSTAIEINGGQKIYALKMALPQLLTPVTPSIRLAFEHKNKKGKFWRHQIGMYFDFGYTEQAAIEKLNGISLQTGLRKYKSKFAKSTSWREFSIDYRYLDVLIGGDFARDNFNFRQRINYNFWQHSLSFNYIWGQTVYLNTNWHIDIGIGIGARINKRSYGGVPNNASFITNGSSLLWNYNQREGLHSTVSVPVILSIGYTWW